MIELLRQFINVESDANFPLFVAFLAAVPRLNGPFLILIRAGKTGFIKSTLVKITGLPADPANTTIVRLGLAQHNLLRLHR